MNPNQVLWRMINLHLVGWSNFRSELTLLSYTNFQTLICPRGLVLLGVKMFRTDGHDLAGKALSLIDKPWNSSSMFSENWLLRANFKSCAQLSITKPAGMVSRTIDWPPEHLRRWDAFCDLFNWLLYHLSCILAIRSDPYSSARAISDSARGMNIIYFARPGLSLNVVFEQRLY